MCRVFYGILSLVQIMALYRTRGKILSQAMMTHFSNAYMRHLWVSGALYIYTYIYIYIYIYFGGGVNELILQLLLLLPDNAVDLRLTQCESNKPKILANVSITKPSKNDPDTTANQITTGPLCILYECALVTNTGPLNAKRKTSYRKRCCWSTWQISERSQKSKRESPGFETSRDLAVRRLTA